MTGGNFRTLASSKVELPQVECACLCLHLLWSMSISLSQIRSVMAWCYVTTLEVWQDLGKILRRGQCRWKNFSLWRKQTAHWLCSLLSACINRPLTSHSVIRSLKHIVVIASVQIQTNWPSVCRGHAQTNSAARIRLKLPSFTLSLTHPHKHVTSCVTWSQRDQWSCPFLWVWFWKQHRGWKSHLVRSLVWSHL